MVLEKIVFRGIISTYVSPFVVALSIIYICIFSKIKVGKHIKRFTSTFAPAAFGVYLLHDNSIIRDNFMKKLYLIVDGDNLLFPLFLIVTIVLIFVICLLIEKIRLIIFEKLYIDKFVNRMIKFVEILLNNIFDRIVSLTSL